MKVKGENFKVKDKAFIDKAATKVSDDQINKKYLKGEIRIVTEQARYPLDTISGLLESGKYNLNPEYQRRKRWSIKQQSKLIESFIINVPIPPIFLYEVNYARYEVMDGLQRLTAIDDFYNGKFALTELEQWTELNGKTYNQLPTKVKEGIDRRYLSSIVLLNETAKTTKEAEFLKQIVFGRLNSGGDKLTPQETRNALYGGKFNNFCIELSRNENFRKLWGFPVIQQVNNKISNEEQLLESESYRKMEDVELVLRYFAYRHIENLSAYKSLENFLDEFLIQANSYSDETINSLRKIFEKTVSIVYTVFKEDAFFMPTIGSRKKTTPTTTIYDPLMQSVSKFLDYEALFKSKSHELYKNKFSNKEKLLIHGKTKNNELFDGKYNNKYDVENRIKYFDTLIKSILMINDINT
jgi:hypothetical protein